MSILESYDDFFINERKQILVGENLYDKKILKIEIERNKNKLNDIQREYEVMKQLNESNVVSCPDVYSLLEISKKELLENEFITGDARETIKKSKKESFFCIEQEYIPDSGDHSFSDIFLSILEQKSVGWYQGDIKPANIRYDEKKCVAYIIDYDQAVPLNEDQQNMSLPEFLSFCDDHDQVRHGIGDFFRHYKNFDKTELSEIIPGGRLDLSKNSLMKKQNTTNTINGIYHTIDEKYFFADGSRTVDQRGDLLKDLEFKSEERILDIGCNNGLLCEYLYERGCKVVGIDNDPHIITLSKMMTNIKGKDIEYRHVDLDHTDEIGSYDTIMLFSVFHHTRNQQENAKKIVDSCNRFIIECRLHENGTQPDGPEGEWQQVSAWRFNSLEEMVEVFEAAFPSFKLTKNLGMGSKGRYVLEFKKNV